MNRRAFLAACIALPVVVAAPAADAFIVFDPSNYAENVLQAARSLEQINNQIRGLQNQLTMLENMAKNLEQLKDSALAPIEQTLGQINNLMRQAQGITFDVGDTDRTFAKLFPDKYAASVTGDTLTMDAQSRWQDSMDALRQTLLVQAQVVGNVRSDSGELSRLVTDSQAAIGSLQAAQATNQLIALSTKQQFQTQSLLAAQFRAEALERARAAEATVQGQARLQRFLGSSKAYTPLR